MSAFILATLQIQEYTAITKKVSNCFKLGLVQGLRKDDTDHLLLLLATSNDTVVFYPMGALKYTSFEIKKNAIN